MPGDLKQMSDAEFARDERLFLKVVADLDKRTLSEDDYQILGISLLLRQLFLDGSDSLIDRVNRKYRLKFTFEVVPPEAIDPNLLTVTTYWMQDEIDPYAGRAARPTTALNRNQFLAATVGLIRGIPVTIKDVILYEAHSVGGVHRSAPKGEPAKTIADSEGIVSLEGCEPPLRQLKAIGNIALKALMPLRNEVLRRHGVNVPPPVAVSEKRRGRIVQSDVSLKSAREDEAPIELLKDFAKVMPDSVEIQLSLAKKYLSQTLALQETDPDTADSLYREAIARFPRCAPLLGNYALFLRNIRKDYDRAKEMYKRTIDANPKNANNLGNYAGLLLARGGQAEGLKMLDSAIDLSKTDNTPGLHAELWFYAFAHRPAKDRPEALRNLKRVLKDGDRSPGWDVSANIERARLDGHPDVEWLRKLADVISGGADIETLDAWDKWREA